MTQALIVDEHTIAALAAHTEMLKAERRLAEKRRAYAQALLHVKDADRNDVGISVDAARAAHEAVIDSASLRSWALHQ